MRLHANARTCPKSRQLLVDRIEGGWSVLEAAEAAGITARTARRWMARWRAEGARGLLDRSSAPKHTPGSSVLVEELPGGELRIISTEKVSERIREIGERVVAEHGEALRILADHDLGSRPTAAMNLEPAIARQRLEKSARDPLTRPHRGEAQRLGCARYVMRGVDVTMLGMTVSAGIEPAGAAPAPP
jgi:transposase